jgi:hypothetical protein
VLIVLSKVMDFENRTNQIHSYWTDLRAIFSQSDQCLDIDDPFQTLLDQIHVSSSIGTPTAQYFLSRLPRGGEFEEGGADAPHTLLLHAPSGLGRTHLLRAIHAELARKPDAGVLYFTGEQFRRHSREAHLRDRREAFLKKCRSAPVFLFDDLHLLSSERSLDVLLALAASLPPRSRLLLAGRTRPPGLLADALNGRRTIELGLPVVWLGIISAGFAILPIFLALQIGRYIDRGHDAHAAWIGSTIILLACVALWAWPTSAVHLLVFTIALGTGHMFLMAAQQMLTVRCANARGRDVAFGHFMVAISIGQGLGPFIVGLVGGAATVPPTAPLWPS